MVDNSTVNSLLSLYAKLAELHGENPFKFRAFSSAAFNLKKIHTDYKDLGDEELLAIPGVGKSVVLVIRDILKHGVFEELNNLLNATPEGVVQILKIKGLGPKKVQLIWRELGIESPGELLDSCRQNRLVETKGFGIKTQSEIIRSIEFAMAADGKWHFARIEPIAQEFLNTLKQIIPNARIEFTGDYRRTSEIIERIEIIVDCKYSELMEYLTHNKYPIELESEEEIQTTLMGQYPVSIIIEEYDFDRKWFETTGSWEHLKDISYDAQEPFETEKVYYQELGLPYIAPELREGLNELKEDFPHENRIEYWQLKGVLHNHTTYSDGLNTLKEMADYACSEKFEYLGICDHSKSAGYANGLSVERLLKQTQEINELNRSFTGFKIFKGVESDILSDGSLDYPNEVLNELDFVVASVHSGLKMDETKAHLRLKTAIENPYTTILGHMTGRLLLMREGYPINHEYIIDACADNGVAIELNAHPYRLDIDWRWIYYAQNKGVMISINPDAHEKSGYHDMYFGVLAARKGGLITSNTLNALGLEEFQSYLNKRHP